MDELTAAGIVDPELRASYLLCKGLNAEHGKTYYLATLALPKSKRPYVHALYAFARYADEIVDDLTSTLTPLQKGEQLHLWGEKVLADIDLGRSSDPIGRALVDAVIRFQIPKRYFIAFLDSMYMDISVARYESYLELSKYMYGSAAVIGLQMLPILGVTSEQARIAAENLGYAFQLTNFIRDIGEDLDRGRIYIPQEELRVHNVTNEMLGERKLTIEIISLLKFQILRVRQLQSEAEKGIYLLDKVSQPCIRAASELYCGIVDEIERRGYDIFARRASTSNIRRVKVGGRAMIQSLYYRSLTPR